MTQEETNQFVAVLKAAYPREEIRPETVRIYARMFEDLDASGVRAWKARAAGTVTRGP